MITWIHQVSTKDEKQHTYRRFFFSFLNLTMTTHWPQPNVRYIWSNPVWKDVQSILLAYKKKLRFECFRARRKKKKTYPWSNNRVVRVLFKYRVSPFGTFRRRFMSETVNALMPYRMVYDIRTKTGNTFLVIDNNFF